MFMAANRFGALCVTAALMLGTAVVAPTTARSQDFHVDTAVDAVSRRESRELSHSVTLFHAGKTYDFIQDLGELVIFDPSHDRFTLLNTRQHRLTEVHVDEVNHLLQIGQQALADYVRSLRNSGKPGQQAMVDALLFQFHPQFTEKIHQTDRGPVLDLNSEFFHYQVLCATPPTPAHGAAYLNYADWIIRLNYVLNPGKTLPEQRIKLDAALRQAGLIPVEVVFGDPNTVEVRARHRIYWELNERDRELIRQWDGLIARGDLKRVSFQEYQRSLIMSVAKQK
jgi:hypothetical protein